MRLLIDTDVFCKLALSGMLNDALAALGVDASECGRLPALPYMLRRGRLARRYGANDCAGLIPTAESLKIIPGPDVNWLDPLVSVTDIDIGEAQLFAYAAQNTLIVMTGDKRALMALKDIEGYGEALAGRIVVLEAILIVLCDRLGPDEVRHKLGSLTTIDKTLMICFSVENSNPRGALKSYYDNLVAELRPLELWTPDLGETA